MEISPISLSPDTSSFQGEDPWDRCVQSGCFDLGAGNIQPFLFSSSATLKERYHALRTLWSLAPAVYRNQDIAILKPKTFGNFEPLANALLFLMGGRSPLDLTWPSQGTISELCQLALLWAIAGKKEARALASWLYPLLQDPASICLWCPEKEYDEKEAFLSLSLLLRSLGEMKQATTWFQQVQGPIDPFFVALAKHAPRIEIDPVDNLRKSFANGMSTTLVLNGERTSLGTVCFKEIEIRALGPHALPLSDPNQFGIRNPLMDTDWTRCAALPEVWFKVESSDATEISLRFMGVTPEKPLAFVFYVKAPLCVIEQFTLKPKSLQRYAGEASSFLFKGKESALEIQSTHTHKSQVIPLAGEGAFWNTEFLLSFEIHPLETWVKFKFNPICF
jgi:hypothetical protein